MKDDGNSPAFWSADGMSFCVKNPQLFLQDIFAVFYESMSLATFEQKLRSWGFVEIPPNSPGDAVKADSQHVHRYAHPYFIRDNKPSVERITSDIKV